MKNDHRPSVRRISDNEVVIGAPRAIAFEQVAEAIQKLGTLKLRDPDENFIDGRIMYGIQAPVTMRVSLVERAPGQTTAVLQAWNPDRHAAEIVSSGFFGMAQRNASKRLVQTLENLGNPDLIPDRFSTEGLRLAALLIGIIIVLWAPWNKN